MDGWCVCVCVCGEISGKGEEREREKYAAEKKDAVSSGLVLLSRRRTGVLSCDCRRRPRPFFFTAPKIDSNQLIPTG